MRIRGFSKVPEPSTASSENTMTETEGEEDADPDVNPSSGKRKRFMDSSNQNNHTNNTPHRKRGRGSTKLPHIVVRKMTNVQPIHVDFDDDMNPIGPQRNQFISYIGFVARSKVGILFPNWKEVHPDIRDNIWADILQTYDVPNTARMKRYWLQQVRQRWKDFKTTLTREYIRGAKQNEDPCAFWTFLDPGDWKKFVASRQDPKFQELSRAQQERQKLNVYHHTMSRGGYRWVTENIKKGDLKAMEEVAKSDSRSIDNLKEQSTHGFFTPSGRIDIMITTMEKSDHLRHVRGEAKAVGPKKCFGRASQSFVQNESNETLVAKIREQVQEEFTEKLKAELLAELRAEMKVELQKSLQELKHSLTQELLKEQSLQELKHSIKQELLEELRDEMRYMNSSMQIGQAPQLQSPQDSTSLQSSKGGCTALALDDDPSGSTDDD